MPLLSFYAFHDYSWSLFSQRPVATVGTAYSLISFVVYFHRPFTPQAIIPHRCLFAPCLDYTPRFRLFLDYRARFSTSFCYPFNSPLCSYPQGGIRNIRSTGERVATFCALPNSRTDSCNCLSLTLRAHMRCSRPFFDCGNCLSDFSAVSHAEPACRFRLFPLLSLQLPCHFSFPEKPYLFEKEKVKIIYNYPSGFQVTEPYALVV